MGKNKKRKNRKPAEEVRRREPWTARFRDPWLWAIFITALAVRVLYLVSVTDVPFFDAPVIDAEMYDSRAMNMLNGVTPDKIFYQAPLYSLFLAAIYIVFGHNFMAVRIIQLLVGAASCALVYVIGRKVFDARAGRIAGFAAALYGPLIHYDSEMLRPVLVIFLSLMMLWTLLKWLEGRHIAWAASAGLLMGLSSITRENILIFAPVAVGFLVFKGKKIRWAPGAAFVLAAALAILPVTIRNYIVEDDFVPISPQGGLNFYIGNSADSNRLMALQPGIEWDKMAFLPREYLGAGTKPSEYSSWFFGETFRDIAGNPGAWIRHMCRKFTLFWTGEELTPNTDLSLYRAESPVLRILVFRMWILWVPFGLVAPFFVAGIIGARPLGEKKLLLLSFVAVYMVSVVLFHLRARYRLPVAPVMLPFAAYGALWLWETIKEGREGMGRAVVAASVALLAVAVFVNGSWTDTSFAHGYPTHYFLAKAHSQKNDDMKALPEFEKALESTPDYPELRHDYGQALIRLGRVEEGVKQVETARDLAPECAFIHKNLGQMYRKKADRLRAQKSAASAADLDADGENLEVAARGFVEMAIREYEAAEKNDPYDSSLKYDLALLYDTGGHRAEFRSKLREYVEEARDKPGEKEWVRISEGLLNSPGIAVEDQSVDTSGISNPVAAPAESAAAYVDRAQLFIRGGNLERARKELERAIELESGNDGAYSLLGNLYKKTGRPDDAEKAYLRALELNPDNLLAHNNIANLFRDSGRFADAEKHYEKALELVPDNHVVKKNRAKLIEMMKK